MMHTDLPLWAAAPARRTDPETAHAAAASVDSATLAGQVLDLLRERPLTTHELAEALGRDLVSVSPRIAPLRNARLVRDSGERHLTPTGRLAIAWEAV